MASTSWFLEENSENALRHSNQTRRRLFKRSDSLPDYGFPSYGPYRQRSESYKFIRMADDFHSVSSYLNDIRICFIALTVVVYLVIIITAIYFCVNRSRRNVNGNQRRPRSQWDYQMEAQTDFRNPGQTEDLVSVRSDGQTGLTPAPSYMGRNHRMAPTFMRHGLQMNHSSQTTRLVADNDGTVKHANLTGPTSTNNNGTETGSRTERGGPKVKEAITDM